MTIHRKIHGLCVVGNDGGGGANDEGVIPTCERKKCTCIHPIQLIKKQKTMVDTQQGLLT
jgi:hypothetical protein